MNPPAPLLTVDLTALAPGQGGGYQRYLENLFDGIRTLPDRPSMQVLAQASAREFVAHMVRDVAQRIDTIDTRSLPHRLATTAMYFARTPADSVALFPGNIRTPGCGARAITVIHDLQYRALPDYWPWRVRVPKAALVRHSVHHSAAVVAISSQTQREVQALAPAHAHKIHVIDNPIVLGNADVQQALTPQEQEQVRSLLGQRFVVTPSTLHPHKNIAALVQAIGQAALSDGQRCKFVFLGHFESAQWPYPRCDAVRVLGYVSNAVHAWLLDHAAGFVLPSMYEGFGIPYFECAGRGKPCLHADLDLTRDYFLPSDPVIASPYDAAHIAPALARFVDLLCAGAAQPLRHRHTMDTYAPGHVAQRYVDLVRRVQGSQATTIPSR